MWMRRSVFVDMNDGGSEGRVVGDNGALGRSLSVQLTRLDLN